MRHQISIESPVNIPEVMEFQNARDYLNQFLQANTSVIEQLRQYIDHYNQTREAAEKVVRARGVTCGDFEIRSQAFKVDSEKLLNAIGREAFIQAGGTLKRKAEAKIDYKQLEIAMAKGQISQEIFNEVTKREDRYHIPSPLYSP
jgi:hypothetical protein